MLISCHETASEKSFASSSLEKLTQVEVEHQRVKSQEHSESVLMRDQKVNFALSRHAVGAERAFSHSLPLLNPLDHDEGGRSNLKAEPTSYLMEGGKINMMGSQYESSLFSSSLSELFSRKCKSPFHNLYKCTCLCLVPLHQL